MSSAATVIPREERMIRARIAEFIAAWNSHNSKEMAALFAEDADLINPLGDVAKSRTEIERLLKEGHTGPLRSSRLTLQPERVHWLAPDIAIVDDAFVITEARDPAGNEIALRGHLTQVLQKYGDKWLVLAFRAMVPPPVAGGGKSVHPPAA